MNGPDERPEVRIAFINADGSIDTTGQNSFGHFETLPSTGDVLVGARLWDDSPEAVVVVGRQFIKPLKEPPRGCLIVRPEKGHRWREVCQLDDETNQAFAEMREERHQEFEDRLRAEAAEKKRLRQEESAARKALQPKGRQPRPRKPK